MLNNYFQYLAKKNPGLAYKLEHAGIPKKADEFLKETYFLSSLISLVIVIALFPFFQFLDISYGYLPVVFIIFFFILKPVFLYQPDTMLSKREKEINKELVFATRFLMIEIQSGVSLYDAMHNLSKNYPAIGKEFNEIISLVELGTSLEEAIEIVTEKTPSMSFRRVLWQILNSLKTGADISTSLGAAIDQITREQMIQVTEYGRKLNPLAMFYMILAVILPSIGITMGVLMSNFLAVSLTLPILLTISGFLIFMQFMFYNIIRNMRPPVDL
ncbi:MAG: type II secretion system F family protein [Candidatus Woesearchaeota archaeon]